MFSKKMGTAMALILLFVVTALLVPVSEKQGGAGNPAGSAVLTLFSPLQECFTRTTGFASSLWTTYFDLVSTSRENRRLRTELAAASQALNECSEVRKQNGRLKNLLGFVQDAGTQVVTALVVGEDPSDWFQAIVINRGTAHGVRNGLAVATPEGVVGKVINVSPYYSQVLLITDPNSAMDARVARTRAKGILEGLSPGACRLRYVMQQEDVESGDTVITSGMDQVFPPGLAVGLVTRAKKSPQGMFQEVDVTPFVNFSKLEEVLVMLPAQTAPEPENP